MAEQPETPSVYLNVSGRASAAIDGMVRKESESVLAGPLAKAEAFEALAQTCTANSGATNNTPAGRRGLRCTVRADVPERADFMGAASNTYGTMKNFGRSALMLAFAGTVALTGCSTNDGGLQEGPESPSIASPQTESSDAENTPKAKQWYPNATQTSAVGSLIDMPSGVLNVRYGKCQGDDIACIPVSVNASKSRKSVDSSEAKSDIRSTIMAVDYSFEEACRESGWSGAKSHVASVSSIREIERGRTDGGIELDLVFGTMSSPKLITAVESPEDLCSQDVRPLTSLYTKG